MMNLFEKLTNKPVTEYVISYLDNVADKKKRFRTPSALREFLKSKKFIRTKTMVEDNNLYVIYTTLNKDGFAIKSSLYFDISKYEKEIKNQLELFNNKLKFQIAESSDEYIIFKLPLRVVSTPTIQNFAPAVVNGSRTNKLTEEDIFNMKYEYHVKGVPATKLASIFKVSYSKALKVVGSEY